MREDIKFIQVVADAGIIANGATYQLDLESIKTEYGHNFNTFSILNNSAEEISITLDGRKTKYINPNGGSWTVDWRDGIIFDDIQIKNESAAASTSANEIRVSVGRTGEDE
jgi:hypothetical protein